MSALIVAALLAAAPSLLILMAWLADSAARRAAWRRIAEARRLDASCLYCEPAARHNAGRIDA